jgi:hypothetical protein
MQLRSMLLRALPGIAVPVLQLKQVKPQPPSRFALWHHEQHAENL